MNKFSQKKTKNMDDLNLFKNIIDGYSVLLRGIPNLENFESLLIEFHNIERVENYSTIISSSNVSFLTDNLLKNAKDLENSSEMVSAI